MNYLDNIDDLSTESVQRQCSIDYIDNYYLGTDKCSLDIGVVYITPYQVLQAFIRKQGIIHDDIIKKIESDILENHGESRVFMKLLRVNFSNFENEDNFYWEVNLQFGVNKLKVTQITREMYEIGLKLQKYVLNLLQSEGIKINREDSVFIEDLIKDYGIKVVDSISTNLQEPFYGNSLNDYLNDLQQKIKSNTEPEHKDELRDR